MLRTQLGWLALATLVCTLLCSALTIEGRYAIPQSSVSIVHGTLPEAIVFARERQRAGEWQFDFAAWGTEEGVFFDEENEITRQWREWKNHIRSLRAYRQQHEDANARNDDGTGDASAEDDAGLGVDKEGAALANYFTERQVEKRIQDRIKKQATFNKTTADGVRGAWLAVRNDIGVLWDKLKSAGTSNTTTDQAYLGLVERHFFHTYTDRRDGARGATTAMSSLFFPALLRAPIVLDAEVLPHIEREVRQLQALWSRCRDTVNSSNATAVVAEVEEQLNALADLISDSRATYTHVITLVDPLADAAASWVSSALIETQDGIGSNDESTEAKRAELKQLVRRRSRLQKAKQLLDRHHNVYKGVLWRNQLPNAEAMLFALELLAKQRLGDVVAGTMEAFPTLSTTAPFTGLLEGESITHALQPFALNLVITSAFVWLAEEVKEWCLRRVHASRGRLAVGGRSPRVGASTTGNTRTRKVFLFACLLEVLVSPLLPAVTLAVHLWSAANWSVAVVQMMRPSQRVVCAVIMLALTVVNYVWGLVMRRLFHLIDPSVYRRRHAKTK